MRRNRFNIYDTAYKVKVFEYLSLIFRYVYIYIYI